MALTRDQVRLVLSGISQEAKEGAAEALVEALARHFERVVTRHTAQTTVEGEDDPGRRIPSVQ